MLRRRLKRILLKNASTRYLMSLRPGAIHSGWTELYGIEISYDELKEELATRPHIPSKPESKILRRKAAYLAQSSKERRRR